VVPTYLPATRYGGPIQSVHGLCRALVELGHEVEVFTTGIDGESDSPVPYNEPVNVDGVRVTYHQGAWPRRLFASRGMAKSLRNRVDEFELVHIHSMFLQPTRLACSMARRYGIPYVLSPRGMLDPELIKARSRIVKSAWIAMFDRRNVEGAAAIHITSAAEGAAIARLKLYPAHQIVIPNGISISEIESFKSWKFAKPPRPYAIYLGRLSWKKGIDQLIASWVHVPNLDLLVVGNDDEEVLPGLHDQVKALGLDARVKFLGYTSGQEKWRLLSEASLFVLPSISENFGIAALEAMAVGCPVIVSPGVGLAEAVSREGCGLVTQSAPDVMGPAIAALLGNPDRLAELGTKAAVVARTKFDWSHIAMQMEHSYEQLLSGRDAHVSNACV